MILDSNHLTWRAEFFRYFVVSAAAFIVDFLIFSCGIRIFGLPWPISATLGFVFGVSTAYVLSIRFVFANRKMRRMPLSEFLAFLSVGLAGLVVTQLTLGIAIEWLQYNPEISKIFAAGFTFLFNFLVRKLVLFNHAASK